MMNRFPGTTTIIATTKSRKCGLMYSGFLRMESEDFEELGNGRDGLMWVSRCSRSQEY
ncbi:hypothetical protein V1515DRAFT_603508, partial [Lipomyces mesembrius]